MSTVFANSVVSIDGKLDVCSRRFRPLIELSGGEQSAITAKLRDRPNVRHARFTNDGHLIVTLGERDDWSAPIVTVINGREQYFQDLHTYVQHLGQCASAWLSDSQLARAS